MNPLKYYISSYHKYLPAINTDETLYDLDMIYVQMEIINV